MLIGIVGKPSVGKSTFLCPDGLSISGGVAGARVAVVAVAAAQAVYCEA